MKKLVLLTALSLAYLTPVHADLQSQLFAIQNAEAKGAANIKAREEKKAREEAERARKQAQIAAANRKAAAERQAKIDTARAAERAKDREYTQKLRDLEIRRQNLEVDVMQAQVDRVDDYIDADINQSKAVTDAIQSEADANRNISEGVKHFLEDGENFKQ